MCVWKDFGEWFISRKKEKNLGQERATRLGRKQERRQETAPESAEDLGPDRAIKIRQKTEEEIGTSTWKS